MTTLAKTGDQPVARPLKVLIPLIKDDLEKAQRAGLPYYQAAGEKLLEAKAQIPHGEFVDWVKRNFPIGRAQAQRYMLLAKAVQTDDEKGSPAIFSTLSKFVGDHRTTHEAPWTAPVKKIVDRVDTEILNLKREALKRAEERDAQRTLALHLIDIGYKILARKLHPDRGGSRDAMARLNAVRDRLKGCA